MKGLPPRLPGAHAHELLERVPKLRMAESVLPGATDFEVDELAHLLNVCFFASLHEDEGRPCVFSLAVQTAEGPGDVTFAETLPFEARTLGKLAAATDPERTDIAVRLDRGTFRILGVRRRDPTSYRDLSIRVLRPGVIAVERWGEVLLLYSDGKPYLFSDESLIHRPTVEPLVELMPEWKATADSAVPSLRGPSRAPAKNATVVREIAIQMARHRHGGMILVVPSNLGQDIPAVTPGYVFAPPGPRLEEDAKNLDRRRQDIDFLGRLTAVDGALVMHADLRARGFGWHVTTTGSAGDDDEVGVEIDPEDLSEKPLRISEFRGARHRAAIRFCQAQAAGIAIVASQDGDVSIFARDPQRDPPRGVVAYGPYRYGVGF